MRDLVGICHDRPSEAHCFGFVVSKLRFRLRLSLACPQYAISDGRFTSRRPEKSRLRQKNCAYSTQDIIVFVDKWVNCLFGSFPYPLYG